MKLSDSCCINKRTKCIHLRYATISSIKKMREIIYFEIFMDWCAILFILSTYITDIIQHTVFISQIAFESHQFPSVFILLRKL